MSYGLITVTLAIACAASVSSAQTAPRYQVAADTLRYTIRNPFRVYWLRGTDTIGAPQDVRSVEAHRWSGSAEQPVVTVRQISLDVGRRTTDHAYVVTPGGRVLEVDGRLPKGGERIDLLLHLPSEPLVTGAQWSDTVRGEGSDPGGAQWYEVHRSYRVARLVDTLGAQRVADVEATGTIRMSFGFWVDSAAGRAAWVDVTGPVVERYLFDASRGRMLARSWDMDLRGRGVSPSGPDTLTAGLFSKSNFTLDDSPGVRFLLASLPGTDTSATIDLATQSAILLHTTDRAPARIASALVRNDGMVGVTELRLRAGAIAEYHATWVDSTRALRTHDISVTEGRLTMKQPGARDTVFAVPPDARWAIADQAMEEMLVPVLMTVPPDSVAHRFAVFRPYARRWDEGTVLAQRRSGVIVFTLRLSTEESAQVVILAPDGDYLFGEAVGAARARRVPVDAARRARLETLLKEAGGG